MRAASVWETLAWSAGVRLAEANPIVPRGQPVVFFVHPHGVQPVAVHLFAAGFGGRFAALCPTEEWRIVTNFRPPGCGRLLGDLGAAAEDAQSIEALLDRGVSVCVFSGGYAEILLNADEARRGELAGVRVRVRRGLLELCVRKAVAAVPVYAAGAADAYEAEVPLVSPWRWPVGARLLGLPTPLPRAPVVVHVGSACRASEASALRAQVEAGLAELQTEALADDEAAHWPRERRKLEFVRPPS